MSGSWETKRDNLEIFLISIIQYLDVIMISETWYVDPVAHFACRKVWTLSYF